MTTLMPSRNCNFNSWMSTFALVLARHLTKPTWPRRFFPQCFVRTMCLPFDARRLLSLLFTFPSPQPMSITVFTIAPLDLTAVKYALSCLSNSSPKSNKRPLFFLGSAVIVTFLCFVSSSSPQCRPFPSLHATFLQPRVSPGVELNCCSHPMLSSTLSNLWLDIRWQLGHSTPVSLHQQTTPACSSLLR